MIRPRCLHRQIPLAPSKTQLVTDLDLFVIFKLQFESVPNKKPHERWDLGNFGPQLGFGLYPKGDGMQR